MPHQAKRFTETGAPRRSQFVRHALTHLACLICLLGTSIGAGAASAAAHTPRHIAASQQLAAIRYAHQAYQSPRTSSHQVAHVPPRTPITGERTTLPVIAHDAAGDSRWLKVMLPGRPNGLSGWIQQGGTRQQSTPWHITINLPARQLHVYRNGQLTKTFNAVVGKPASPTPTGSFFVQETVILGTNLPGGPFALALSARSNTFSEFDGGPGQIAIHGRDQLGGTLGHAQSHGCIRLATPAIDWLAARIGPGVPVNIY